MGRRRGKGGDRRGADAEMQREREREELGSARMEEEGLMPDDYRTDLDKRV